MRVFMRCGRGSDRVGQGRRAEQQDLLTCTHRKEAQQVERGNPHTLQLHNARHSCRDSTVGGLPHTPALQSKWDCVFLSNKRHPRPPCPPHRHAAPPGKSRTQAPLQTLVPAAGEGQGHRFGLTPGKVVRMGSNTSKSTASRTQQAKFWLQVQIVKDHGPLNHSHLQEKALILWQARQPRVRPQELEPGCICKWEGSIRLIRDEDARAALLLSAHQRRTHPLLPRAPGALAAPCLSQQPAGTPTAAAHPRPTCCSKPWRAPPTAARRPCPLGRCPGGR